MTSIDGKKNSSEVDVQEYSQSVKELLSETLTTAEFSYSSVDFIRDMSLVYLVAEFESFLRDMLKIIFQIKPEVLSSSEKSIPYEELVKFKRISDTLEQIVEKEASSVVDQDIEKVKKYFDDRFKINMANHTEWKFFKERF